MSNYTQRLLAVTISLILVVGVTPAFADPASIQNVKPNTPSAPAAFLPTSDFTVTDAVISGAIDCFSFDATSVGGAAGEIFFAATDNDIGGPNPDTMLASFSAAGCNIANLLVFNDDGSPLGDFLASSITGFVNPDGFIYLGVTGFNDAGFSGAHSQSGPYDLSVVVGGDGNDALGEAELVASSLFTSPEPTEVTPRPGSVTATISGTGGGNDVDYYQFSFCNEDTSFIADMDNTPFTFDTILSLFDSDGTLIAFDDDTSPVDAGSASVLDSFIGQITLPPGTYFVAVSQFANFPNADNTCSSSTALDIGGQEVSGCTFGDSSFASNGLDLGFDYNLHLSLLGGDLSCMVGGELLPIDSTALILAGLQSSAIWMLPVLAGVAGSAFGVLYIKSRRN